MATDRAIDPDRIDEALALSRASGMKAFIDRGELPTSMLRAALRGGFVAIQHGLAPHASRFGMIHPCESLRSINATRCSTSAALKRSPFSRVAALPRPVAP